MTPVPRKLVLTLHVGSSVGWLGAVAAFVVLAVAGVTSDDPELVRGAYRAMNLVGWCAIVPLSVLGVLVGVVQAVATPWGLFQHWWVAVKLLLSLVTTGLLLLHQYAAVAEAARRVAETPAPGVRDLGGLGTQLVADSVAAFVILAGITAISVFKPWGRVREGGGSPALALVVGGIVVFVVVFVVVHALGGGLHHG